MINKEVGYFKYRKMIKNSNGFIYNDKKNDKMIKLDRDSAIQMKETNSVSIYTPKIDTTQIAELSDKQKYVKRTSLPEGVVFYGYLPIGVIYPYFFEDYKTFDRLYLESSELIFNNLKKAYYKNLELLENDIYNKDLSFKNIMYNGGFVELVDLDGKLIGKKYNSTYNQVYQDYIHDLYILMKKKLELIYGKDSNEALNEIKYLFRKNTGEMNIDYPLHLIENIEKKRILK